ncbi:MAG: HAMP domain-containing histidine kinase [Prolixibacteraceae bacterium]|nr:HAMP domain-containing histidine kinase [Prolixibacteraceae bacterium]
MKKRIFIGLFVANVAVLIFIAVVEFLALPGNTQRMLSTGVYLIAAIAGGIIGSLLAKIVMLRRQIAHEKSELQKRMEHIQTYLTNVVHDLRSPVASIHMIAELLEEEVKGLDNVHAELITSVKKSSHSMLNRICCILDNAALEQSIEPQVLVFDNPYPILKTVLDKHHILAIDKHIDLQMEANPDLPKVCFDADALDRVFSNLVSNAIKYSQPRTKVTITAVSQQKMLVIAVKDQGLGLTSDDLSKVFGRFAKLSARPTGNEASTGLGLSIVKQLVEKMHGRVKAFSEGQGKGATFSVFLSRSYHSKALSA